jgi:hypothetical protein
LPIKNELLQSLEKSDIKSKAVLIHDNNENSIWLADDSEFTAANKFDTEYKREISGLMQTTDSSASLEDRGGLIGVAQQRIAELLGIPELARFQSAKKIIKSFIGSTPQDTANNFSSSFKKLDFYGVRTKILAIMNNTLKELEILLTDFKDNSSSFKLTTSKGKEITYSAAQIKQNLLFFAQAKKQIEQLISDIEKCKTMGDIVFIIYNDPINSLFSSSIRESVEILSENANPKLRELKGFDALDICQAYTATLLASQFLLRTGDNKTSALLKDSSHSNLKTYSQSMSPLNCWGHILFNYKSKDVSSQLDSKTISELKVITGRILTGRTSKLHQSLSANNNLVQDWEFQFQSAKLLVMRLSTRSQSINMIISGIRYWNDIMLSDKNTIAAKIYFYLQQHVPNSPLLTQVRQVINLIATQASKENGMNKDTIEDITKEQFLLFLPPTDLMVEAPMGGSTVLNSLATNGTGTFSDAREPSQADTKPSFSATPVSKDNNNNRQEIKFMNGKPIVKRQRDYTRKKRYARPVNTTAASNRKFDSDSMQIKEEEGTVAGDIAAVPTRLFDKKVIKRKKPGYNDVEDKDLLKQKFFKAIVEWTDEDFSGDTRLDEGFNLLRNKFKIVPTLIAEKTDKTEWPLVKLIGEKHQLELFLTSLYGASDEFISEHVKPL